MNRVMIRGQEVNSSDEQRFWKKVSRREVSQCWPWTAGCDREGYGRFRIGRAGVEAHRVAYAMFLPEDFEESAHYLHSCDNPTCCNPWHIYKGSHAENMAQAGRRGRMRSPRPGNGVTKLSLADRRRIVSEVKSGQTKSAVARRYGVTPSRIRQIYQGAAR